MAPFIPSRRNAPGPKIKKFGGAVAPKSQNFVPKFKKKIERNLGFNVKNEVWMVVEVLRMG